MCRANLPLQVPANVIRNLVPINGEDVEVVSDAAVSVPATLITCVTEVIDVLIEAEERRGARRERWYLPTKSTPIPRIPVCLAVPALVNVPEVGRVLSERPSVISVPIPARRAHRHDAPRFCSPHVPEQVTGVAQHVVAHLACERAALFICRWTRWWRNWDRWGGWRRHFRRYWRWWERRHRLGRWHGWGRLVVARIAAQARGKVALIHPRFAVSEAPDHATWGRECGLWRRR